MRAFKECNTFIRSVPLKLTAKVLWRLYVCTQSWHRAFTHSLGEPILWVEGLATDSLELLIAKAAAPKLCVKELKLHTVMCHPVQKACVSFKVEQSYSPHVGVCKNKWEKVGHQHSTGVFYGVVKNQGFGTAESLHRDNKPNYTFTIYFHDTIKHTSGWSLWALNKRLMVEWGAV